MSKIPLGEAESQRLEFKAADALGNPESIAKSVVGLLNAQGGEIWVGLRSDNEHAVSLESVPDADAACRSLRDHLLDTVEPAPNENEISIDPVTHESGARLVVLRVGPGGRGPYAYVRGTARHFLRRVGARLRPMTRDEIIDRKTEDPEASKIELALAEEAREVRDGLWVRLQPVPDRPALDLDDPEYAQLLMEPTKTGNRPEGWNFANPYKSPDHGLERLVQETPNLKRVDLHASGGITLRVPKHRLRWRDEDLYPFVLIEYATSVLRLGAAVYRHARLTDRLVIAQAGLYDVEGLVLRPGSPVHEEFRFTPERPPYRERDIPLTPRRFRLPEIIEEPDRCASRLWREFYRAFGYDQAAWPHEYDPVTGRLMIGRR